MSSENTPEIIAAVDLGSNSFHMVIGRVIDREIRIIDRLKEPVRLAEGLNEDYALSKLVQLRALACLERFGQRLRFVEPAHVRVVGTNTLRKVHAANGIFLELAQEALGQRIEVISGLEEARLVYQGVAHSVEGAGQRRLVVDIGGGSTECIVGQGFAPLQADSLYMGCVTWTQRYFGDGQISRARFERGILGARQQLGPIEALYCDLGWDRALGSSGTVRAIAEILRANGWSEDGISQVGLSKLIKQMCQSKTIKQLKLSGLKANRAPVIVGGTAILKAVFEAFDLKEMTPSPGALREGVLYDLLGRIHHDDNRDQTVRAMAERYRVEQQQASRVERTALRLFEQLKPHWPALDEEARHLISWAARLHEMGQAVAYAGHHKHGAYLLSHSDMPGFSQGEKSLLAAMVRLHRRRCDLSYVEPLSLRNRRLLRHAVPILRLGVLLNRSHSRRPIPPLTVTAGDELLSLHFPEGWLELHPLTLADLQEEAALLPRLGMELSFD